MYLGVDIGGTFTDLVLVDEGGRVGTAKALTTPATLEDGLFEAIALAAAARGMQIEELLAQVKTFGHGTTQATNALIERSGAITGLITTRGFGDTMALQRLQGFNAGVPTENLGWYSRKRYPEPLVPRHLVEEVGERVDQAGNILLPLDEDDARGAVARLVERGVETFAVALLWSFRNPAHERRIGALIAERLPQAFVSLSSSVAPVIGEYERSATTVLNSYLATKVVGYLKRVDALLRSRGFRGNFFVLNSMGGVMPASDAADKPVVLVMSGPTGGVMGSLELAQAQGFRNVITTDMGGTSFDVALIVDGKPLVAPKHEAGGFHISMPMIDIRAIGAGGGSIARVEHGLITIGPDSAGARPGPVCYGRGGARVTVTDADVALGIIDPDNFLGGRMRLDRPAALAAIEAQVARPLGLTVDQAAAGIRRIVDAAMADTLREVTVGRGHDPRDFVIFAYGGAGPVHCAGYGAELGVPRIVVPATSMGHCAYGALASDIHQTAERTQTMQGGGGTRALWEGIDVDVVAGLFHGLEQDCRAAIVRAGIPPEEVELLRSVDVRYARQTHDLIVEFPAGRVDEAALAVAAQRFEQAYESAYGKGAAFRDAGIEFTTFRVKGIGRTRIPALRATAAVTTPRPTTRPLFEPRAGRLVSARIWQWPELPVGTRVEGPAVIEHPETAVYIGLGQVASLDATGNLSIVTEDAA